MAFFHPESVPTTVVSDASGSWGCGAFDTRSGQWFQLQWPESWLAVNIAIKELIPIVIAVAIWGHQWSKGRVHCLSDNMAVVWALSSRAVWDPHLSHLLRCLFFYEAHYKCEISASHIAGKANGAADALSRNQLSSFFSYFPQACPSPSALPPTLVSLLVDPLLTWTSPRWERLFRCSFHAD